MPARWCRSPHPSWCSSQGAPRPPAGRSLDRGEAAAGEAAGWRTSLAEPGHPTGAGAGTGEGAGPGQRGARWA